MTGLRGFGKTARDTFARAGLTWRFAIAAAAVFVALGTVLASLLGHFIAENAIEDHHNGARDIIAREVLRELSPGDLDAGLGSEGLATFDGFVRRDVLAGDTVRLTVWNREGRVVYSSAPDLVGQEFAANTERSSALDGRTVSAISSPGAAGDPDPGKLIDVYTPIVFAGADTPEGVLQLRQRYGPLASRIADQRRTMALTTAGGLATLYLLLLGIVHSGTRTIRRQREQLEHAVEEQSRDRQERDRLAAILESTPDFVGTADPQGHVLYLNRAARRMLGLGEDEPIEGRMVPQDHPGWAAARMVKEAFPAAIRDGTWSGESAVLGPGGQEIPTSQVVVAHKAPDGSLQFLSTIVRDISDRKRAEEALFRREEEFRLLFAANPQPLSVYDPATLDCIEVNDAMVALHGYSRDEFLRMKVTDVVDPSEVPRLLEYIGMRDPATTDAGEWRHRLKDGRQIWVHVRSHAVDFDGRAARLVITEDITARKQAEAALRLSEAQFRLLFAANPQPMLVYSPETLEFMEVNDAAVQQYGYSREEFLQLTARDIRPADEVPLLLDYLARRNPSRIDSGEWRHRRKDGSVIWVHVRSHALTFDGEGARLIIAEDITARRETEEAIARLAAIVESSDDAIVGSDLEGRITSWNAAAGRVYGYTTGEVLGDRGDFLLPDDRRDEMDLLVARARLGEHIGRFETVRIDASGRTVDISMSVFPIRDHSGVAVGVASFSRDITEQKRAERALAESEQKFRDLVQSIDAIVCEFEAQTGRCTFVSEQAERMLGYALEKWLKEPNFWADHIHPEDWQAVTAIRREAIGAGRDYALEYRMFAEDGRVVWLQDLVTVVKTSGVPAGLRGVMFDISERKRTEEALARLAAIVESSDEAVVVVNLDGAVATWNAAAERLSGRVAADVVGQPLAEAIPSLMETVSPALARATAGEPVEDFEMQGTTGSGKRVALLVSVFPVHDANGRVTGIAGIARDISERRRMQEALLQSQKIESLGVLAGGVAHDFNNLLTVILGNAGLALRELDPGSPARQTIREIEVASLRGADLARQMLAYSGGGASVVERIDLNALVKDTARLLLPSFGGKRTIEEHLGAGLPPVEADVTQVRQVLMNLIVNATEAIGQQAGTISISTGVMHADRAYLEETYLDPGLDEGDYVYVDVTDNGGGMDAATRARIFDPFFTTKFAGRGLGLAAVLGIVRSHRGAMKVTSEPGEGTTFRVLFPLASGGRRRAPGRSLSAR